MILTFNINPLSGGFTSQIVKCDYTQLKFVLNNDDGKGKFEVSGTIKLLGTDYDFYNDSVLVAANGYEIICYGDGGTFFTANYKFIQTTVENKSLKQISISLRAETEYTDEAWVYYDTEYNINDITSESNDLYFLPGYIGVERDTDTFTDKRLANNTEVNGSLGISEWNIEYVDDLIGIQDPINLWNEYEGVVHFVRERALGYYVDSVAYTPDEDAGWVYISDVTIGGVDYPEYYRATAATTYTFYQNYPTPGGAEPWDYIKNAGLPYNKPAIDYTGVTRTVSNVIEWLIGEMGLSISFDSSGTSTDSFYSFKSMIGESLTYGSTTSDKLYDRLLIMNLTDFTPADDDGQKDRPAEITNISLKTLLEYFNSLGFEWYLENRAGTFYFKLQYLEDKSLGSSNPDLSNYKGKNWLPYANILEREPPEFNKIINETTCKSLDFVGTECIFTNILNLKVTKIITDTQIFTDLNDIAERRVDAYSETEDNNIVIIAALKDGSTKDYVRAATGERTATLVNNSELSFSYLCENIYCYYPDDDFTVNGSDFTASAYRLKKRNKYKITVPGDNITSDFDVSDYLLWFTDQAEIKSISQSADSNLFDIIFNI